MKQAVTSNLKRNIVILIATLVCLWTMQSQAGMTGMISGKVLDYDNNPIRGVKLTIRGVDSTPGMRIVKSNKKGSFRVPQLAPGTYDVLAEKDGWKSEERKGIKVSVNQTVRVDFLMGPANATP